MYICKDETDFELNMNTKRAELQTKGYPNEILDRAEQEIRKKERSELLKANKKPVDEFDRTFLITTYTEYAGCAITARIPVNFGAAHGKS